MPVIVKNQQELDELERQYRETGTFPGMPLPAPAVATPTPAPTTTASTGPVPYGGSLFPGAGQIDAALSQQILGLLNPPALFPDTSRRAAELSAARGVPGTAAAYGTGLRMTDEERLRRIALGEQLASSAYRRNVPGVITPSQQASLDLQRQWQSFSEWLQRQQQAQRTGALAPTTTIAGGAPSFGPSWTSLGGGGGGGAPAMPANPIIGGYGTLPLQDVPTWAGGGEDYHIPQFQGPPAPNAVGDEFSFDDYLGALLGGDLGVPTETGETFGPPVPGDFGEYDGYTFPWEEIGG